MNSCLSHTGEPELGSAFQVCLTSSEQSKGSLPSTCWPCSAWCSQKVHWLPLQQGHVPGSCSAWCPPGAHGLSCKSAFSWASPRLFLPSCRTAFPFLNTVKSCWPISVAFPGPSEYQATLGHQPFLPVFYLLQINWGCTMSHYPGNQWRC